MKKKLMIGLMLSLIILFGVTTVITKENSKKAPGASADKGSQQTSEKQSEADSESETASELKQGLVKQEDGIYYYENGEACTTGFKEVDGNTYYFGTDGKALTGTQNMETLYCKFSDEGVLLRKIDKTGKLVALTYDDGPSIYTPAILDALEANGAVATFFVVGNRVPDYADHVKREYALGCEIGNHTYEHKILTKLSADQITSQISKTQQAVSDVIGIEPKITRPTGGGVNSTVSSTVPMPLIIWSVDTLDWKNREKSSVENNCLSVVSDGDIVLMHDLYQSTADAAPTIISTLKERGFQFVTVSELAEIRGTTMENGVKYNSFAPKKESTEEQ